VQATRRLVRAVKITGARAGFWGRAVMALALSSAFICTAACSKPPPAKDSPEAMNDAHDPVLLLEKGRAFARMGDLSRAQEYLISAIDNGADVTRVLPMLLHVCVAAGNFHAATEYGDRVLQAHPTNSRLRFVVGTLYASTGETLKGREYLEQVAREQPKDARVEFALGVLVRDDLNDFAGADKYFRAYLALAPNGPHAEEARASLMNDVQRPTDAPSPMPVAPVSPPVSPPATGPSAGAGSGAKANANDDSKEPKTP
jgi:tetratricopeptide (TPR) repeat protein